MEILIFLFHDNFCIVLYVNKEQLMFSFLQCTCIEAICTSMNRLIVQQGYKDVYNQVVLYVIYQYDFINLNVDGILNEYKQ